MLFSKKAVVIRLPIAVDVQPHAIIKEDPVVSLDLIVDEIIGNAKARNNELEVWAV